MNVGAPGSVASNGFGDSLVAGAGVESGACAGAGAVFSLVVVSACGTISAATFLCWQ